MCNFIKCLRCDIANGRGFRTTVFFSGCDREPKCKGCFNSSAWSPKAGKPFTEEIIRKIITVSEPYWCEGLSILGGEPTAPWNIKSAIELAKKFKKAYPNKDVWMWSGRYIEEIEQLKHGRELLEVVDVLIDGPFEEDKKDLSLKWMGSSNQRIINTKKWLKDHPTLLQKIISFFVKK